jgi:hypothetical protein
MIFILTVEDSTYNKKSGEPTKYPRQNIPATKHPKPQNIPNTKRPKPQTSKPLYVLNKKVSATK